jgi:ABC-type multidrug transport system fused ATPase/permease subunit
MRQLTRLLRYAVPYWWQVLVSVILMAVVGFLDAFRLLLIGPITKRMGKNEITWKVVPPNTVDPTEIEMESFGLSVFEVNTRLAVALQLHAQGERRLASAFFSGCLAQDCGHHFSIFYQPAALAPERAVAHLAWAWLANRLLDPDSSRTELLQTARKVFKALPELENDRS